MILRRLTLRLKLIASFGVFAAIALCLGVLGFTSLRDVSQIYGVISTEATPSLNRIYTMNLTASQMQDSMQSIFLNADAPDIVLEKMGDFRTLRDELENIRKTEEAKQLSGPMFETMKSVNQTWSSINTHSEKILQLVETGDPGDRLAALRLFSTDYARDVSTFKKYLNELLTMQNNTVDQQTEQAKGLVAVRNKFITILLAIGFFVAIVVGYLIARSLGKLVQSVQSVTQTLSAGSESLASSAHELSSASQQLAAGSTQGAASLEETVASLEELSSMVKVNAESALEAAKLSQESSESASESEAQIQKLNSAMDEMKKSSKRISEIIDVIDDIAFQTNLLALNAAVEAARAGEQGRGFAVVAEAVRGLAQRSAEAAKDINVLINENMVNTEQGVDIVEKSGVAFNSIITVIKRVAVLNGEIAAASQHQADGLSQINKSMTQLDTIMQDSSVSAERAANSSIKLNEEASSIRETIYALNGVISGNSQKRPSQSHNEMDSNTIEIEKRDKNTDEDQNDRKSA